MLDTCNMINNTVRINYYTTIPTTTVKIKPYDSNSCHIININYLIWPDKLLAKNTTIAYYKNNDKN